MATQITGVTVQILTIKDFHTEEPIQQQNFLIKISIVNRIQQTSVAKGQSLLWNESFFFNFEDVKDEDIQFAVFSEGSFIGNNKVAQKSVSIKSILTAAKRQSKNYQIPLEKNGSRVGVLVINLNTFDHQQITGAVGVPLLSVAPKEMPKKVQPVKFQYTIEKVKVARNNFYSCMDNDNTTDWEFFPKKYKQLSDYDQ